MSIQQIKTLAIEQLQPGQYQPRKKFNQEKLQLLADSIKENGLIQPIVVRPVVGGYEILAGERRWRACQLIGLSEVEVTIRQADDLTAAAIALSENIQREDLTLIEEAVGLARLRTEFGITDGQIADAVGRSRTEVCRMIGITHLPARVKEHIIKEELTYGHAKLLLPLSPGDQLQLGTRAATKRWSVKRLALAIKNNKPDRSIQTTAGEGGQAAQLKQTLDERLQTPTQVQWQPGQPNMKVTIKTWGSEGLQGILERLDALPDKAGKGATVTLTLDAEHYEDLDWLW